MELGLAVRLAREKKGWSQAYVARKLGVTRAAITNIEKGRSKGGGATIPKLLALLDINPHSIGSYASPPEPGPGIVPRHPGVEALAQNDNLRRALSITADEIDALRMISPLITHGPITSVNRAIAFLHAIRLADEPLP